MSVTNRQNKLLIAEDWTKIYQSFKNANFQSYDFENLRRIMVDYIRVNYPEDFNDYIESSEYLALIDLIAYVGQSIAFRVDLNARDNFLELSERRDAILRLSRLISYNAKRNTSASGLLKITTISTTESIIDSNGRNLSGQVVTWNDTTNNNWYDQFIKVMNAAFPNTQQFGNPADSATIYAIPTDQYRFNSNISGIPVFSFTKSISGMVMNFEITSTTFVNGLGYIYEEPPRIGNTMACVFRNDGQGYGSANSGFFFNFTQGTLNQGTFTITQPSSNESINIDASNINDSDVWLYGLDTNGNESQRWTQVSNFQANNIIYNSVNKSIRDIYSVLTRTGDMISLQFSDGTFGTLPLGSFRTYYRISNGLNYTVNPIDVRSVAMSIPYTSATGQAQTLSITLGLAAAVVNAATAETNDSIKANAPATYYTQDRMITGEDYNISPLASNTNVLKIKSVNRTASGISRYFDLIDPTGKYSSTRLFADDGVLYTERYLPQLKFSYQSTIDIEGIIYNTIYPLLQSDDLKNFYYSNFTNIITSSLNVQWENVTSDSNSSSGYISDISGSTFYKLGGYTSTDLKYLVPGSLIKFNAPAGWYFDTTQANKLKLGVATLSGSSNSIWAAVISVTADGTALGTGVLTSGLGPVILDIVVPTTAVLTKIIPAWAMTINSTVITEIIDLVFSNTPFGLRYDSVNQVWAIVYGANLDTLSNFSLGNQGDTSNRQLDSSWLLSFTTDNIIYTVASRQQRYIFESTGQIRFISELSNLYNSPTGVVVKDSINILSINTAPNNTIPFTIDQIWDISAEYIGLDGYIDTSKTIMTFADTDSNGIADDPELFFNIVTPQSQLTASGTGGLNSITVVDATTIVVGMSVTGTGIGIGAHVARISGNIITLTVINAADVSGFINFNLTTYIIEQKYSITSGQEDYRYVSNVNDTVLIFETQVLIGVLSQYIDGQYFYFVDTDVVMKLNLVAAILEPTLDYKVYIGRDKLKFQYNHNADHESRIDPGTTNIIDVYVLTNNYDSTYRQWLYGANLAKPLPPGSDELNDMLSPSLNLIKSISDEIVYHPVNYKVIFGSAADLSLQASFKVVKNVGQVISDNDIKSSIITAINNFFVIDNWDFGDTFYFTELSAYVTTQLAPNIANFVIVPRQAGLSFGSLYEISSASDEIFVSGATVNDIDIVTSLTQSIIKAIAGTTVSTTVLSQQIITSSAYGATNGR